VRSVDLLAVAVIDVCIVMRSEGKGRERDRLTGNAWCILHAHKGQAACHIWINERHVQV